MRRIDRSCLAAMASPIRHLMETNVGNSIFTVAPERQAEFDKTLNNFDLIFKNQRLWECCADPAPDKREIFLSRGAVELIWCSSLAHFRYCTRLIKGRRFNKPTEIVQANLMITALDLYAGKFGGKTHPYSFDRLTSMLDRFLTNERHVAKALAFAVLDLHFNNSSRKMKNQTFEGPEEALDALCNQLAEEVKSRKPKAQKK